ncbi:ribonuclease H-like domain-containing protein [Tanacetum coccineum]
MGGRRMFLSQQKYALELVKQAHMIHCNLTRTPVDTESKLSPDGDPIFDPTLYRSLAGGLQYLTVTCPDLSYDVQQGTLDFGLQFYSSSTTVLIAYSGWVSNTTLLRSSVKAEYRGVANSVAETAWLRNLLRELHTPLQTANLVYCDNMSAIYMSTNPVQHQRTKHIKINIHFIRDKVTKGHVRVLHVPSRYQYPDIFTKRLPSTSFEEFRSSLSVRSSTARTAEECNYYNSRSLATTISVGNPSLTTVSDRFVIEIVCR